MEKNRAGHQGFGDQGSQALARDARPGQRMGERFARQVLHSRQARRAERKQRGNQHPVPARVFAGGFGQVRLLLVKFNLMDEQVAHGLERFLVIQSGQMIPLAILV